MPTIRIDPTPKGKNAKRAGSSAVGTAIAARAFPLSYTMPVIGAYFGDQFGKVLSNFGKEPVYPFEVDTDTNLVKLLAPDPRGSINAKTKALAPKIERLNSEVQAQLQLVWDSGGIPQHFPKRYKALAGELLSQRAVFFRDAPAAVDSFTQYSENQNMGIIPPGGFAGFAQMTPASKAAMGVGKILRKFGGKKRRKKAKKAGGKRKKRKSKAKRAGKRLVKGSAAAKKFMANLRRRRK